MNQTPSWIPEEADLHTHTAPAKNSINTTPPHARVPYRETAKEPLAFLLFLPSLHFPGEFV